MGTYTQNILLSLPTPFDPAVANIWGTILNTNFSLLDSSIAGILNKSVAGSSNVVLSNVAGSPDESRYAMFNFTGVITASIDVLWPQTQTGIFTVKNATTGAFTLSLAVNNGSGGPLGAVAVVPQGTTGVFYSDGTNVSARISAGALGALQATNNLSDVNSASTSRTNLGLTNGATTTVFIQAGGSPSGGVNGDLFFIY